mgnify:CR=1 FL=1|jgi:hypothetical protein
MKQLQNVPDVNACSGYSCLMNMIHCTCERAASSNSAVFDLRPPNPAMLRPAAARGFHRYFPAPGLLHTFVAFHPKLQRTIQLKI